MKNPHILNFTWINSWWPEIWPHEYLVSLIQSCVNCLFHIFGTRPICTVFNGTNYEFMRSYLGPTWTDSHQVWDLEVSTSLGFGGLSSFSTNTWYSKRWNAKKKKIKNCDVITSVLYGDQIGGLTGCSCIQNNLTSFGLYVTCFYCWSENEDKYA